VAEVDAIAVTCAPGLVGSLLVGLMGAKTLALLHDKPLIGVHHLEGHLFSGFLAEPDLRPPCLCLLVSGGHTSLIWMKDYGQYQTVGRTRDDAAGEAFDKWRGCWGWAIRGDRRLTAGLSRGIQSGSRCQRAKWSIPTTQASAA